MFVGAHTTALDGGIKLTIGKHSQTLDLSIGPVTGKITLDGGSFPFVEAARLRYAAFLAKTRIKSPSFSLRLQLRDDADVQAPPQVSASFAPALTAMASATRACAQRWDFNFDLAAPSRTASPWIGRGFCAQSPYALDSLVRVMWSMFLPRVGAMLVHACGVIHPQHGAFVFPGRSTSGKTTLARKIEDPDRVLSDELVVLGLDEKGAAKAWGTPFWGEFQRGGVSMKDHPLRGIFFLEQGTGVRTMALPPSQGVFRFLECFLCFQQDFDTARSHLELVSGLLNKVPFGTLVSRRTSSEQQVFKALAAHRTPGSFVAKHARAA